MNKRFLKYGALICLMLFLCVQLMAQDILKRPTPPKLVNDVADVLSPEQEASLERKLVVFRSNIDQDRIAVFRVIHFQGPKDFGGPVQWINKLAPGLNVHADLTTRLLLGILYCFNDMLGFRSRKHRFTSRTPY